jgi:hypothetical protein
MHTYIYIEVCTCSTTGCQRIFWTGYVYRVYIVYIYTYLLLHFTMYIHTDYYALLYIYILTITLYYIYTYLLLHFTIYIHTDYYTLLYIYILTITLYYIYTYLLLHFTIYIRTITQYCIRTITLYYIEYTYSKV